MTVKNLQNSEKKIVHKNFNLLVPFPETAALLK